MNRSLLLLLSLLAGGLAGCPVANDDDSASNDDDDSAGGDDDDAAGSSLMALTTHAAFGGDATLAAVSLDDLTIEDSLLGLAGSDWAITVADGDPWLLGRFFIDTVRRYDGMDFSAPTLEFSTGAGTNPHALAVCGDRIFVTRYDTTEDLTAGGDVAMFDLSTGGPLGTVDLSAFDPHADGTPEPDGIVEVDGTVYVSIQRLDRDNGWAADPVGKLVAIDCATGTVTDDWDVGANPEIEAIPALPGVLQVRREGGIDFFDTSTGTVTGAISDANLGAGYESLFIGAEPGRVLLITEVNFGTNEVLCLDLNTGDQTVLASQDQRGWSARTAPDGNLWVLWRDHWATDTTVEVGGIAIYDPTTCEEVTTEWLTFNEDPYFLTFYEVE